MISEVSEDDEEAENMAMPYVPPQEAHNIGAMASSDMVFSMFGGSQGAIHGSTFMDRTIECFKGLTMSNDEYDGRLPLLPRIDN